MKGKLFLAATLAGAMMFSLIACGPAATTPGDATQAPAGPAGASATEAAQPVENTFAGYPINTTETLTMWNPSIAALHTSYTTYKESPFHMGLEEKTGIQVDWQFPTAGTDANQAFNLMLASDVLPDILANNNLFGNAQQYIDDGILRDLSGYFPNNSPAYWSLLEGDEHFNKSMKTDNGQYWAYGIFRESPWAATFSGPVIRQDWLTEQGLSMPQTMEDWDHVLRTFKEAYGAQLAFFPSRSNPGFASAYGAYTTLGTANYVDDAGKVQYALARPEWKNYMKQLHTWYSEGLIDPDTLTLDDAGMRSKALNNKAGASITAISQLTNWANDAKQANSNADWVGVSYVPNKENGTICTIQGEDMVSPYAAAITTSCPDEKLELAMRWLDYGYTEEGFLYWNYGTEGETYTMVEGKPVFTELLTKDPEGLSLALPKYIGTHQAGFAIQAEGMVRQKNAPASVQAVDVWTGQPNGLFDHMYPAGVSLTTQESSEVSALAAAVNTYASEMALKFFTGEETLDNFDQFVETLNSMGLPQMMEIYQAAYDRFTTR